jgi:alpha-ribazole phosphatase
MATVTRWWWLRHAPTDAPESLLVGRLDLPAAVEEAHPDVQAMASCLPAGALWVSSPLRRARDTAQALFAAGIRPIPELIEPAFAEQSYGLWDGLTYEQIEERFPEESEQLWRAPATMRPPEGESFADVVARVREAVLRLCVAHPGRDIVVVAHSGTIRAALALALDLSPDRALRMQVAPLSLTRIDLVNSAVDGWRIEAVNLPGL